MSGDLQEAQEKTESLSRRTDQRFGSLAQSRAASSRQRRTQLQDHTLEADSRSAARLRALEARVEQLEARRDQTHRSRAERPKHSGPTLGDGETSAESESSLRCELQLLKQEHHKGFLAVHAAIKSLRQIGDIKSRLDKEKLQRDVSKPAR